MAVLPTISILAHCIFIRTIIKFQPDPVDYHAIAIVVIDGPGGLRVRPAGGSCGGRILGPVEVGFQPDSGRVGHSARPRLSSRPSLSLPVCLRMAPDDRIDRMTDAQWRCLHSFLITCPDVRVGKETHCRLFVDAARWMTRMGAPLAPVARRVRQVELGLSPLCPRV